MSHLTPIPAILLTILSFMLVIGTYCVLHPDKRNPDWRGIRRQRFRWSKLRREFGRYCYKTNWQGETMTHWWEWEKP